MHNSADHTEQNAASGSVHSGVSAISSGETRSSEPQNNSSEQSGQTRSAELPDKPDGHLLDFSDKDHADKVLRELPMAEFLKVLERSTPEELELMLANASPVKRPSPNRALLPRLAGRFFALSAPRSGGAVETYCWWEARRVQYNLVVGATGLFTLAVVQLCGLGFGGIVFAAIPYGIMANICYSCGWISDYIARHFWKEKAENFGVILYCQGTAFSILLTLLPAALAMAAALLGVTHGGLP